MVIGRWLEGVVRRALAKEIDAAVDRVICAKQSNDVFLERLGAMNRLVDEARRWEHAARTLLGDGPVCGGPRSLEQVEQRVAARCEEAN